MPVPACPTCANPHSPDVRCRFADFALTAYERIADQLRASIQHEQDSDCTVDPETLICTVCLVDHSDPCPACNGRGFHKSTCFWMSPVMLGLEATL